MAEKISKIVDLIQASGKIGLISHRDTDPDGFGSLLALDRTLRAGGKEVIIFSNEPLLTLYEFLGDQVEYTPVAGYQSIDLLICLDFNNSGRATVPEVPHAARKNGVKIIVIDHHQTLGDITDAEVLWQDTKISCVSEMVFYLISKLGIKVDKLIATYILSGIASDTGSFQYSNTAPETFQVVAELLKSGAQINKVTEGIFGKKPLTDVKLLGRVMERIHFNSKLGIAVSYITQKDIEELNLSEKLTSGVASFIDQIKGPNVIAVFTEREPGLIKVSLRANKSEVDVAKIAEFFGGGGHAKAAGFEFKGTIEEILGRD